MDADYLAYYAAGNDQTSPGRARLNALGKIEAMQAMTGSERTVLHLTAQESNKGWRGLLATTRPYQGQRLPRKPNNWRSLRDWMETYQGPAFKSKIWTDREADDGIAYHSTVLGSDLAAIATADKDMRMFGGVHIDWTTYDIVQVPHGAYKIMGSNGKLYGTKWFWQQMLQGDTADNIPGLERYTKPNGTPGRVGEKTAVKLLASVETHSEAAATVIQLYQDTYQDDWPERVAEQATLLWMRLDKQAAVSSWLEAFRTVLEYYPELEVVGAQQRAWVRRAIKEVADVEANAGRY